MTLARPFGIPLRVHPLFALVAAVLVLWQGSAGGWVGALSGAALLLVVFGSVALHELGHALAARGFGIATRSITLHPLGGLAALDREPADPTEELVVALAGPVVNVGLAAVFGALWWAGLPGVGVVAAVNLGMALFNLLPAFPMDGGRVLRAALTPRRGSVEATRVALDVARLLAWGFVALGLFVSLNLALVGGLLLAMHGLERRRLASMASREDAQPDRPTRLQRSGRWTGRAWPHPVR